MNFLIFWYDRIVCTQLNKGPVVYLFFDYSNFSLYALLLRSSYYGLLIAILHAEYASQVICGGLECSNFINVK